MPVVDASVVVDWVAPDADPDLPAVLLLDRLASAGAEVLAVELHAKRLAPRFLLRG